MWSSAMVAPLRVVSRRAFKGEAVGLTGSRWAWLGGRWWAWLLHCYPWVSEFQGEAVEGAVRALDGGVSGAVVSKCRSLGDVAQGQQGTCRGQQLLPRMWEKSSQSARRKALGPINNLQLGELAGFVRWSQCGASTMLVQQLAASSSGFSGASGAAVAETSHHSGFSNFDESRARRATRRAAVILPPGIQFVRL